MNVPAGVCYGQTDVPLCCSFETEAQKVKSNLSENIFDEVYTSPLSRCVRLADFCGFPNAIQDERIKEINFGKWEMTPFSDLTDSYAQKWFNDWINTPTPDGESLMDEYERVSSFLDELLTHKISSACIFTHGGVITCARAYASEYDISHAFKHIPSYGEIIEITLQNLRELPYTI